MENGEVVIMSAGTGNPFFTTDTGSSLRGIGDGILLLNPGTAQRGYAALLQVDAAGHAQGELLSF